MTGDVVNIAARLQSAAPVGAVIVDEATRRSTENVITFEPLEPVAAKGKAAPIAVWRATHARSRVGQPEAATHAPFVGREHERALLLETFFRAERESSVQLVTVVGEPGIGKSRLVTELRTALDERSGPRHLASRALPALRRGHHVLGARGDRQGRGGDPRVGRPACRCVQARGDRRKSLPR